MMLPKAYPFSMIYIAAMAFSCPIAAQTPATSPQGSDGEINTQISPVPGAGVEVPGQSSKNPNSLEEIVVTAQKRSQSINSVGESITAVSGSTLVQEGITSTADLTKIVPGFNFTPSPYGQPVYVLRGVGLFESGQGSSPAVSVYLDQFPLTSAVESEVPPLDLERVEVLKGPQGTLFGENSTGGAINYIAAKPTPTFEAGEDLTYEQYDKVDASGFVSGPLADSLNARLAVRVVDGGAYQDSLTRPGDRLGNSRIYQGRLLLDWHASDTLRFELNVNGFHDGSDTQANQLTAIIPAIPANAAPSLARSPLAPNDPLAADWPAGVPLRSDDSLYQLNLRIDYDASPDIAVTSLTGWQHFDENKTVDQSGIAGPCADFGNGPCGVSDTVGSSAAFTQEIRATAHQGPALWTLGAYYDHNDINEDVLDDVNFTVGRPLPNLPAFHYLGAETDEAISDYAVFGNLDYSFTPSLIAHAGLRGTESDRRGYSDTFDWFPAGDSDGLAAQFDGLQQLFSALGLKTTPVVPISLGGPVSLTPAPDLSPSGVNNTLNEKNLSYRFGLDYKIPDGALFYVSASQGYKSGIISTFLASTTTEFVPAKQEKLDAYELGVKIPFLDDRLHFDGAAFYYDYFDKQVRSRVADPTFGLLEVLVNIPRSWVRGLEAQVDARPLPGLDLSLGGEYLDSEVSGSFLSYNQQGAFGDFKGSALPYTPKAELFANGQYRRPISNRLDAFLGATETYHSDSYATFNTASAPAPAYRLNPYSLLDLRAGISAQDDSWRLNFFAQNVTNKFYLTTVFQAEDTRYRDTGLPRICGLTFTTRWR